MKPILFILSGLPGSGKTTLGKMLAARWNAAYIRIDTIEQGILDLCSLKVEDQGYGLAYRISADNLKNGLSVVADSCNAIGITRTDWERTAIENDALSVNLEIICSDEEEHRQRVEKRVADIPGLSQPTWVDVVNREYHPWTKERIVIDTANRSVDECFNELNGKLEVRHQRPISI
jgi:predicted kinase